MPEMEIKMLSITDIQKLLPHRYPFLMVDRILSVEKNKKVIGLKNVTINEPYFEGHFPDEPIMPGVLILETMAQTGGFIFDIEGARGYVAGINKAKFLRAVLPGDQLIVEMELEQQLGAMGKVKGVVKVENVKVAEAEITYRFVKLK